MAPLMKLSTPWMSLSTMAVAYGFLGWRLSRYAAIWAIDSWLVACGVILIFIFYGHRFDRLTRMGPRSIATIFLLSMLVTIATTYSEFFVISLVLLLSSILARLELRSLGVSRGFTIFLLLILSASFMSGGWFWGRYQISRTPALIRPAAPKTPPTVPTR
jgi:membrane-associated HD superfamily phosphohydrolase